MTQSDTTCNEIFAMGEMLPKFVSQRVDIPLF